jgi:phosphatidylserine/phosphatidylglycerophosphate/cardiolipin synthase-like enzyme
MKTNRIVSYVIILTSAICILVSLQVKTNSASHFLRQVLIPKNGQILRAMFTPQDNIRQTIINLIKSEKKAIKVAAFYFTDQAIAEALMNSKKISIEIITDHKHVAACPHTKIYELYKAGIPIHVFENMNKYGIFHHKFLFFKENIDDKTILLTGSFNLTSMAQDQNQENVIITDNPDITSSYLNQFNELKKKSQPLERFIKKHRIK